MTLTERNALVESALPITKRQAFRLSKKLEARGIPIERSDLVNEAVIGLIDAAGRYDAGPGVPFPAFAYHRSLGAMIEFMRKSALVPRGRWEELEAVERGAAELEQRAHREPTLAEAARYVGLNPARCKRVELTRQHALVESLDEVLPTKYGHPEARVETVPSKETGPAELALKTECRSTLLDAIAKLPHRQRVVVVMADLDRIGLKVIGACMGIGESRVSQIRKEAHKTLRDLLTGSVLDPAA